MAIDERRLNKAKAIGDIDMGEAMIVVDQRCTVRDALDAIEFPKLYVHRDVFSQLQAIQRSQVSPKFDLKDIGSSALRIVLALPNGADLIKQRVMQDFLDRRRA